MLTTNGYHLPDRDLIADLTFETAFAPATLEVPVGLPCMEGAYDCARAKDIRYSLWSTVWAPDKVYITPNGRRFVAEFIGDDALLLGDLNDSGYVDLDDWARWNYQFLTADIPLIPDPPCGPPPPDPTDQLQQHADFSGDGYVTALDFSHIYTHFAWGDDEMCCYDGVGAPASGPRMRIPVAELELMGLPNAAGYDRNNDGWVDAAEVGLLPPKKRPDFEPAVRPTAGSR
jgi:hypothetical protein